jgi:beta-lactamase class A
MARLLRAALESEALGRASKDQLLRWMKSATTGQDRIPAGVPRGWRVAHKTGTGDNGTVNDVAVIFPPRGPPVYLCVFTDGRGAGTAAHEAAIAEATRLVLGTLADPE